MNPANSTYLTGPDAASEPRPHFEEPVNPLTGDDLLGDLDPGWLDWRDDQSAR